MTVRPAILRTARALAASAVAWTAATASAQLNLGVPEELKGIDIIENLDGPVTAKHVALMMDWVKTARLLETIDHEDSWVDKVGYSALGGSFDAE